MIDFITYKSEFKPNYSINLVFSSHKDYFSVYKDLFNRYGFGFLIPDEKIIIIDGEILVNHLNSMNYLKFIEAHEISHIIFGHNGERNDEDEQVADYYAYYLLKKYNYTDAVILLKDVFFERHGEYFSEDKLSDILLKNACF